MKEKLEADMEKYREVLKEASVLRSGKVTDYGITYNLHPYWVPLVIQQKIHRILNLMDADEDPNYESLRDSYIDILNYAAMGVMCLDDSNKRE